MITDILIAPFRTPIHVNPGDKVIVEHQVFCEDKVVLNKVVEHEIRDKGTWTHSIMFKLNGELQYMLGTLKTVAWLESLGPTNVPPGNG